MLQIPSPLDRKSELATYAAGSRDAKPTRNIAPIFPSHGIIPKEKAHVQCPLSDKYVPRDKSLPETAAVTRHLSLSNHS